MKRPEINPGNAPAPRLAPQELKRWLDQGRDIVLLDTRNQFEVDLGSFENTVALGLKSFSDFPRASSTLDENLKDRPIVTYCTGGIRCEKAAPWLIRQGFREVYQLDGGIFDYFEQCGGAHFRGECFVSTGAWRWTQACARASAGRACAIQSTTVRACPGARASMRPMR